MPFNTQHTTINGDSLRQPAFFCQSHVLPKIIIHSPNQCWKCFSE